jgi:hypothetical protein
VNGAVKTVDTVGTNRLTPAAADTVHIAEFQHRLPADALGIVTPAAVQVAALEKNGGADTGAVIGTEFLDVENRCGGGGKRGMIHAWAPPFFFDFIIWRKKSNGKRKTGLIQSDQAG